MTIGWFMSGVKRSEGGYHGRSRSRRPADFPALPRRSDLRRPDCGRFDRHRRHEHRNDEPGARRAVRRPRQFSAPGGAAVHLRRRDHGPRRHRPPAGRMGIVDRRRGARLACARSGRVLGIVRLDVGIERRLCRRHRQADDSGIDPPGLYRGVLGQPNCLLRRCCDDHSALDHHDHLRRRRPAIRAQAVPGRHRSGTSDRGSGFDLPAHLCTNSR